VRVDRETNKDTEIMPLVRWQFRGLPQDQRKGWLFSNVRGDRKGYGRGRVWRRRRAARTPADFAEVVPALAGPAG
jgi:hypothetical protein